jgi:transcriptional regulator GlxA family with amidase domain
VGATIVAMRIAIALYENLTALDAVGPYEVLGRLPGAEVVFTAARVGPVRTDQGSLALVADATFDDVPEPDVVLVPGWPPNMPIPDVDALVGWLRRVDAHTRWTTSVCTGSLLLGMAGLLTGRRATTHWAAMDMLAAHGAVPVAQRHVIDGKYATAAGVSAGLDMALTLAAALTDVTTAQAIQLGIEYDPEPPYDAGSPRTAPAELVPVVRSVLIDRPV